MYVFLERLAQDVFFEVLDQPLSLNTLVAFDTMTRPPNQGTVPSVRRTGSHPAWASEVPPGGPGFLAVHSADPTLLLNCSHLEWRRTGYQTATLVAHTPPIC
jgi:hypothetical protein